ncbi:MAG: hypothetical protein HOI53_09600 [Francisellaceae bacterium]|jgi:intracellular multiplication protein IcmC|nr:hypothetical protein [Francisellaceae bacterium]MBT6538264.1 hypothetical protein [Francisellaceae bacterium]
MNYRMSAKSTIISCFLVLLVIPEIAMAADVHTILNNLRQQIIVPFTKFLFVMCYVAGIYFIWRGIGILRQFGMPLTQASKPGEIAGPIVFLFVGALLLYLPSTTDAVSQTIFGDDQAGVFNSVGSGAPRVNYAAAGLASEALFGYLPQGIEAKWSDLINTLVLFIEFIGFIAFIRGLFMISKAGNPGVQPGSITKGITHLVGGIIAINFIPAVEILHNSMFTS